jgi:hypothetical protein
MGEFGAVSVVSGHIRGVTTTMPLHIEILYNEYEYVAVFAVASLRSQGHWRKSPSSQNQAHQLDWSSCQGGSDHPMGIPVLVELSQDRFQALHLKKDEEVFLIPRGLKIFAGARVKTPKWES